MSFIIDFKKKDYDNKINPNDVAKDFCDIYYMIMMTKGFAGLLYLFDVDALCNFNGKEMIGIYSVLTELASIGIAKLIHDKLSCSTSIIDPNTLLLQVTGLCQGVAYSGQNTITYSFSEIFTLRYNCITGRFSVHNYLFKLL